MSFMLGGGVSIAFLSPFRKLNDPRSLILHVKVMFSQPLLPPLSLDAHPQGNGLFGSWCLRCNTLEQEPIFVEEDLLLVCFRLCSCPYFSLMLRCGASWCCCGNADVLTCSWLWGHVGSLHHRLFTHSISSAAAREAKPHGCCEGSALGLARRVLRTTFLKTQSHVLASPGE